MPHRHTPAANKPFHTVLKGYSFLEDPRWHEGRLWCSDFYTGQVIALNHHGQVEVMAETAGQPSGLGWLPDGRTLIVSMLDRKILRREHNGELVEHADLSHLAGGHLNDMVVDDLGRAYVGNFGFPLKAGATIQPATLARVDPDGSTHVAAHDLLFPNGCVILPDGPLVVAETMAQRLTAFDVDANGNLSNRRTWASFGDPPESNDMNTTVAQANAGPDGICADAEGMIWVADAFNHRVMRVREGGEVTEELHTGELRAFACTLGGADGRTLYVCAAPSASERQRRATRESVLLACKVNVPHAGRP